MVELTLLRLSTNGRQTLGRLDVWRDERKTFECFTLELAWAGNARRESCIPTGTYPVAPRWSKRFSEHLHVLDVPDRKWILIHPGNYVSDTAGCILVGEQVTDLNADGLMDVTNSRKTMHALLRAVGQTPTTLEVEAVRPMLKPLPAAWIAAPSPAAMIPEDIHVLEAPVNPALPTAGPKENPSPSPVASILSTLTTPLATRFAQLSKTMKNFSIDFIAGLIGQILDLVTPQLKHKLTEFLDELEADAAATPNPWDDLFIRFVKIILGIERSPEPQPPQREA